MKAKLAEREEARRLYSEGMSYNAIHEKMGVAKSSISNWCRDLRVVKKKKTDAAKTLTKTLLLPGAIEAEFPFVNCRYYLYRSADNCQRIQLVNLVTKKRDVMALARYLMSVKLGRFLTKDEIVKHRSGYDDNIDNLYVTTRAQIKQDRIKFLTRECPTCKKTFVAQRPGTKTCSPKCRAQMILQTPYVRECVICEETFETKSNRQDVCNSDSCRSIIANERYRERRRGYYG